MDNFDRAQVRFLEAISKVDGAKRCDLPPADRENDKVRQKCRRDGLAVYEERVLGKRWYITEKGRNFIAINAD